MGILCATAIPGCKASNIDPTDTNRFTPSQWQCCAVKTAFLAIAVPLHRPGPPVTTTVFRYPAVGKPPHTRVLSVFRHRNFTFSTYLGSRSKYVAPTRVSRAPNEAAGNKEETMEGELSAVFSVRT